MNKCKRLLVCVLMAVMAVSLFAGCSKISKKSWLYACDSDNLLAFEGYYYSKDSLYLVFDTDHISKKNFPSGMYYEMKEEEWSEYSRLSLRLEDSLSSYKVDPDDIDVEVKNGKLLISFEMDKKDAKDITGFSISFGSGYYNVNLEEGFIKAEVYGGECSNIFTQTYNAKKNKWSEVEEEFILYPMTEWVED